MTPAEILWRVGILVLVGLGIWASAAWLKRTVEDNALLRQQVVNTQSMLDEAEENTKFERKRASDAEALSKQLRQDKDASQKELRIWKENYAKLLENDPQAKAWGDLPVPRAITDSLRSRDAARDANRVRGNQVAGGSERGLPDPAASRPGLNENRAVPGDRGGTPDGARRVQ